MQITPSDLEPRNSTPKLYRHTKCRVPMTHPETGDVITVPRNPTVIREKSRMENTPWWEPIQMGRDYAEMLQRPEWGWSLFGHLTFREAIHPEAADKVFNRWVHNINRSIYGSRYWNQKKTKGVLWARGSEMQKREVLHYHFLMSRVPETVQRLRLMDEWNKLAGFARIHPFETAKGGEVYVVKYAAKGGEIDFGGPLSLLADRLPSL